MKTLLIVVVVVVLGFFGVPFVQEKGYFSGFMKQKEQPYERELAKTEKIQLPEDDDDDDDEGMLDLRPKKNNFKGLIDSDDEEIPDIVSGNQKPKKRKGGLEHAAENVPRLSKPY